VIKMLLNVYLWGTLVTAVGTLVAAYALYKGAEAGLFSRAGLSIVAGALWPLLAVGLVQTLIIMLVTEMARRDIARHSEQAPPSRDRELITTH
jgi:hypothetical protein